jgi:hypothetical protein
MTQNALTVVARIKPDQVEGLRTLLTDIGNDIRNNTYIPFAKLTTTHFARWVILEVDGPYPASLAFESNYDGDLDAYLSQLFAAAGPGLDAIYSKCEGYGAAAKTSPAQFSAYMKANSLPYGAFHIAYRGEAVQNVQDGRQIREKIEQFLDAAGQSLDKLPAAAIREKIVQSLGTIPPSAKLENSRVGIVLFSIVAILTLLAMFKMFPIFGWVVFGALLLFVIVLLIHEMNDQSISGQSPVHAEQALIRREDHQVQNQLTHLVEIKPGLFRLYTLKTVLWVINQLAIHWFNRGSLGGIPTIHFARWVLIDNNKRLLFFSNFDGSWDSYLGDFVDKASVGLTAVWSNTCDFPKTWLLALAGAKDVEPFKQWARDHQVQTQVWYSSCPHDSVQNVLNNVKIHEGLRQPMDKTQAELWLQCL